MPEATLLDGVQQLQVARKLDPNASHLALYWGAMQRYILWYVLAAFWAAIAMAGLYQHHTGNAVLEGAVATLFIVVGISVKRRDDAARARRSIKPAE